MTDKQKTKNENISVKLARKDLLDINLIEILAGERKGTFSENRKLEQLKKELGDSFYAELIYAITNIRPPSPKEAKHTFNKILNHKNKLSKRLNRNVGIQTALVDYLKNIKNVLKEPVVMEKKQINEMARESVMDELTRTFDKNVLYYDLNKEIQQTKRYGTKFSILMIDLDNLKDINDKYGHVFGDKVLAALSDVFKKNIRAADSLYRFGGDEYAVLLPRSGQSSAKKVAQKLINTANRISVQNKKINISVSVGVASFNKNNIKDADGVINTADKALYSAKKRGKGRADSVQKESFLKLEKKAKKEKRDKLKTDEELSHLRFEVSGTSISPGLAVGKTFIYRDILSRTADFRKLKKGELFKELSRIKDALKMVEKDIIKTRNRVEDLLGKEHGNIFDSHRLLLNDPLVFQELKTELYNERVNAEHVVRIAFKRIENKFKSSNNEIISEKADDIADLSKRLIRALTKTDKNILSRVPPESVIVSNRLLPSDTVNLKRNNVNAIVTEKGSISSHAAILARSLNIPCLAELSCSMQQIMNNRNIIVDTEREKIIVNPEKKEIDKYRKFIEEKNKKETEIFEKSKRIKLEKDNTKIRIMANVASEEECRQAVIYGSDGVGIYRIESLYIGKSVPPTEKELEKKLKAAFDHLGSKEITIRLLDIGGDKPLPYLPHIEERATQLGLRGVRVLLKNPKVLRNQLSAMIKLSRDYNIKILVPMVTLPKEISQIKETLDKIRKELGVENDIEIGSMIETPASVIKIRELLKISNFVSIGTNDLIQYTMASGRENVSVADYYEAGSRIVLKFVVDVIKQADKAGKECVLCGELASNTQYTRRLLRAGLKNFSVSVPYIPRVKNKIADILDSD